MGRHANGTYFPPIAEGLAMPPVDHEELQVFARRVIEAFGTPPEIAQAVAEELVGADLRGHGSHGVRRLSSLYQWMVENDQLVPDARPDVVKEAASVAQVDGHRGWGHAIGREAADLAIEKAQEHAVGMVGVRNTNHMGRMGAFAERAADVGLGFVILTNTGGLAPTVAPPGSADREIGNNPIAMGVPSYDIVPFSIVLDIAVSQVAHGKIMKRDMAGKPLPEEWAIADSGEPLTDARAFEEGEGAILPLGGTAFGYKGAGLSFGSELLVAMAAGGEVLGGPDRSEGRVNNSALFVAFDPEWFSSAEHNRSAVATFVDHLRDIDYREDIPTGQAWEDHALLPGEPEYHLRTEREANGIPLDDGTIVKLREVATDYGVSELPTGF